MDNTVATLEENPLKGIDGHYRDHTCREYVCSTGAIPEGKTCTLQGLRLKKTFQQIKVL